MKYYLFLLISLLFIGCTEPGKLIKINGVNVRYNRDELRRINFYMPDYNLDFDSKIMLYYAVRDGDKKPSYLEFSLRFSNRDWLNIKKCIWDIDGKIYNFDFTKSDKIVITRNIIWEVCDVKVTKDLEPLIKAIIDGYRVKIQYVGDKGTLDGEIPGASQKEMRDIYQLYFEQGGVIK